MDTSKLKAKKKPATRQKSRGNNCEIKFTHSEFLVSSCPILSHTNTVLAPHFVCWDIVTLLIPEKKNSINNTLLQRSQDSIIVLNSLKE